MIKDKRMLAVGDELARVDVVAGNGHARGPGPHHLEFYHTFTMPELDADAELELATLLSSLQVEREAVASELEGARHA
jgi:hypothetical protein